MAKKKKEKKEKDPSAPRQEVDAVKGFIFVMILLIVALAVFIVITNKQLAEYQQVLDTSQRYTRTFADQANDIKAYLKLMRESEEKTLRIYPERFFGSIYAQRDIGISQETVKLSDRSERKQRRDGYVEHFWPLRIEGLTRRQAALFLWGIEKKNPKAKTIEIRMRRDKKAGEDVWNGDFEVGYRVASGK